MCLSRSPIYDTQKPNTVLTDPAPRIKILQWQFENNPFFTVRHQNNILFGFTYEKSKVNLLSYTCLNNFIKDMFGCRKVLEKRKSVKENNIRNV